MVFRSTNVMEVEKECNKEIRFLGIQAGHPNTRTKEGHEKANYWSEFRRTETKIIEREKRDKKQKLMDQRVTVVLRINDQPNSIWLKLITHDCVD